METTFDVSVMECNAEKFSEDYSEYIESEFTDYFGNHVFNLTAPQEVRDEISGLGEEGIEILDEE